MSLRLRQLEIRIKSLRGTFGVRIAMRSRGLVIIRANNTSGKSTSVQSLIYALGLEAMLTVSQQTPPLQYAVLERFQYGDEDIPVDESEVLLEVENGSGKIITIQRAIKSATRRTNLISVWHGPLLTTADGIYDKSDFFVRIEGAAQRPLGFHTFFAEYLGLELPKVSKFDGSEVPLYLECIFPLFIIEQKHGWSGIQARMPTHFQIREMGKRAIEFVLKLDSYRIATQRQRLREQMNSIASKWERYVADLDAKIAVRGGVLRNMPKSVPREWPPVPAPLCLMFDGKNWERVEVAELRMAARIDELAKVEVPTVIDAAERVTRSLEQAQSERRSLEASITLAGRDSEIEEAQNSSLRERIPALEVDLQNYQDLKRLRDIGSELTLSVVSGRCPTCDQEVNDVLLPQTGSPAPMSFDNNIKYITGQIGAFTAMLADSDRVLNARRRSITAMKAKIQDLSLNIRAYKQTLVSANGNASAADVRERMTLEANMQMCRTMEQQLEESLTRLEPLARDFAEYAAAFEKLKSDVSDLDEAKLQALQASLVSQLDQYGFSSIKPPSLLRISRETFRPTYEGFDLGFNLSASDMIRTIWAYTYGLMEVSRIFSTNHIGTLVLDEPRQQQANKASFAEFAKRAATSTETGEQVVFLTSEDPETLMAMLAGVDYQYIDYGDSTMIRPLLI
jgi:hypothetical protein